MKKFSQSKSFFAKARRIIPLASQTFSKSYLQYVQNAPLFINRGEGAYVWDIDGNKYLDLVNALSPIVLGYQYKPVDDAIKRQLQKGIIFSLASPLEYQLAKKIIQLIPCAEMVRFGKNGSDATAGTVRLARAVTKRDHIAACGYHGWQDWYIGLNPRNEGVPNAVKDLVHKFAYNDIQSLKALFKKYPGQFAAVIMEPMSVEEPRDGFLQKVKELAHANNALLIFDEVVTGFRFGLGGAQKYFKVIPDLAAFGKAMANGMPISVVVGKAMYMKKMEDIFFSFTFGGECLSLAASLATIEEIEKKNVIAHIWRIGKYLQDGVRNLIKKYGLETCIELKGKPCWHVFLFKAFGGFSDLEIKSYMQQELLERGVLWTGSHSMTFSHKKSDIERLLKIYDQVFEKLASVLKNSSLKKELRSNPMKGNYSVRNL